MTDWQALTRLPEELKQTPRWCIAGPDKAPYLVSNGKLYHAKVTSTDFLTFEDACTLGQKHKGSGIGYILGAVDPFTCIDLDVKTAANEPDASKHTAPEQLARFSQIIAAFDSYTEYSRSGVGMHIWVRGDIGQGCRRDGVEVYSQERFMICTGNAFADKPIEERPELLEVLAREVRRGETQALTDLVEINEVEADSVILERASSAHNSDKFQGLYQGRWQEVEYPSQSEADLALMSMFTFYSQSKAQCRRLFRASGLGQRRKATKNDRYLNYTLSRIRARQQAEAVVDTACLMEGNNFLIDYENDQKSKVTLAQEELDRLQSVPPEGVEAAAKAVQATTLPAVDNGLSWPPGLAGAIAAFIYNSSPRPVKEVAIVGALGLLAGIAGKAYSVPQSGLNIYLILVARSAIGKEAMHSGLSHIIAELREQYPLVQNFVDFTDFASGPALVKACASNPCFVNVAGEWGQKLKRLSEDHNNGPMQQLRTVMTNLYQKSGPTAVVGGLSYSNKDQNISSVNGVAYSMIGETTPGTFYDSLTDTMMEDGFLSRFTIIEYRGERPAANKAPVVTMDPNLKQGIAHLATHALTLLQRADNCDVNIDPLAFKMINEFDRECDSEIRKAGDDESQRQMWNRAHLKAIRVAALLAVADNYLLPMIHPEHIEWALDLIRRDIGIMARRIAEGDIGKGDHTRERKLLATINAYLGKTLSPSYRIPDKLRTDGIVPRKFLQIRLARINAFTSHRSGANFAMDTSLKSLIDSGYIMEMDKVKLIDGYGFHGRAFRVLNLPQISC